MAPRLLQESYNPRSHDNPQRRGPILARDGTILAATVHGQRTYPLGRMLAQTIGYASPRYGASGLEATYSKILAPTTAGKSLTERLQELIHHATPSTNRPNGQVITTISPRIQTTLFTELAGYGCAAGIVLDPRNGDVLAIASVPSFEPENVDDHFHSLSTDTRSSLMNRALNGLYPPGSTFKIITASIALEDGVVTPTERFYDPGFLLVGNARLHDDEGEATGSQNLAGAFRLSSNVDFAQMGLRIGAPRFYGGMRAFGVGSVVRFPLDVERDHYASLNSIGDSILAQMAFGQADLLVTPLRMALVAATIAEGGIQPQPRIVTETIDEHQQRQVIASKVLGRAISAQTAKMVNAYMVGVVENGTGTAAALSGVTIAGKTGTATNPHGAPHSWFVAFAPADVPRVAIAVVVENGGYGGTVAAPIARRVLATALAATERTK